jgi:hypothetical protein
MFEPCSGFLNQDYGNFSILTRVIVSMTQIKELLILLLIEMCLCHGMIEIMLKIMLIMSTQLNFGSIKELGKSFRLLFLLHLPVCVCHCCSLE